MAKRSSHGCLLSDWTQLELYEVELIQAVLSHVDLFRLEWSQVKMSVSVYLKTHRFLEVEAWPKGVLSLPMI
jgi:hypothetical protein